MEKTTDDNFFVVASHVVKDEKDLESLSQSGLADVVDADFVAPTEEELNTLRHVPDRVNWATYLIAFIEMAERFSFYGSTVVFVNFIQQPRPAGSPTGAGFNGQSGALGQGQRVSTGLTTLNQFWSYVTPLLGAYVADTYWGRFNTIAVSVAIALVGHVLLIVSALPPVLDHPQGALGVLSLAIVVMGLGTGGFKSNISPLIAEQQKNLKPFVVTRKDGERVIIDPTLTTSRIYMVYFISLVGQITMVFAEKWVGFWLSYTLPTIVYLCCPIILVIGRNLYRRTPPQGSVLGNTLRIWRYAARGKWSWNPVTTFKRLTASDFWDSARPSRIPPEMRPGWIVFDDAWVDEVRRGLKACTVFCWFPLYWLTYNQMINNLTSQAATMTLHGAPNDVINNLDPLALIVFIPIFDGFIYPFLRRAGINFSPIRRITLGFLVGSAAMVWAAVTQHYIYKMSPCGYFAGDPGCDPAPINVWQQTGAYVLIAFSEIFASITGLEYAFTKAPGNMKSLVMAVFLFASAIAAALGEAFTSLSQDPLLVWNYGVMAVLSGVGGVLFWLSFYKLDKEESALNKIPDAHYDPNSM
ncbi:peptide transporter PTR2A [Vararia minispora EC-137]|uniref:Peptide transporter PTR2A n=1 Tax=Vararia minispora EC-137 TaxID=1314806 RepID=A0ACB8QZ88_9AGAM|nr:peptide transporter PTR2A [Vararia minispora EC-137]